MIGVSSTLSSASTWYLETGKIIQILPHLDYLEQEADDRQGVAVLRQPDLSHAFELSVVKDESHLQGEVVSIHSMLGSLTAVRPKMEVNVTKCIPATEINQPLIK